MNTKELKIAVLIDADNVPYSNVKGMMEEIAKFGIPTTKRIYADWTKPNAAGWPVFSKCNGNLAALETGRHSRPGMPL